LLLDHMSNACANSSTRNSLDSRDVLPLRRQLSRSRRRRNEKDPMLAHRISDCLNGWLTD
jgi:hypothetical protein